MKICILVVKLFQLCILSYEVSINFPQNLKTLSLSKDMVFYVFLVHCSMKTTMNVFPNYFLTYHHVCQFKSFWMLLPISGVRANTILCLSCKKWVLKQCSDIKKCLRNCKDFICKICSTVAEADDSFPTCITIDTGFWNC